MLGPRACSPAGNPDPVHYLPPDVAVIRATPWQLATLCGVWNYNILTCPTFITAPFSSPRVSAIWPAMRV